MSLQGFQTYTRQNIILGVGQTLTVDAQMQVATLQESVTVTAESPVVDVKSTAVGNTIDTAKLIGVPSSSDLWGALAQAPGVQMQGFDVGGSHKSQQDGYVAFGVPSQNRIITEGVDTTEGTGGAGFYQDYFAQNEIAVSGAGQDVAMNTPGAAVISTIKGGGNQFRGLINQTYEPKSFVGDNASSDDTARGGQANPNLLFWENHDDFGGPIVKDKAWFYAAYDHFHINKQISGVPTATATDLGHLQHLHDEGNLQAVAGRHADRLLRMEQEAEAVPQPVGDDRTGLDAGADQPELDVQRQVAARLDEPAVHRVEHRRVRLRLPGSAVGRLHDPRRRTTICRPASTRAPAGSTRRASPGRSTSSAPSRRSSPR